MKKNIVFFMLVLTLAFSAVEVYGQTTLSGTYEVNRANSLTFSGNNFSGTILLDNDGGAGVFNVSGNYTISGNTLSLNILKLDGKDFKEKFNFKIIDANTLEDSVNGFLMSRTWKKKGGSSSQSSTSNTPQQQPANAQYKIGDRGPAGGIVFYDKGNNNGGWRYLEAAPADLQRADWGMYEDIVEGTETGIGSGKKNTELIIAALNRKGESGKAAQLCRAYTLNGYNDWFLPSNDELNLMYTNLKQRGLGGFKTTEDRTNWTHTYWSSSQRDNINRHIIAHVQDFTDGSQGVMQKDFKRSVRAVRAF